MKSANLSKPLKLLSFLAALLSLAPVVVAQDNGYVPPPMFDDMATPMVRPQSDTGNIVEQKSSPNTILPPETPNIKQAIPPRVSTTPDAVRAPVTPVKPAVKPPVPQKMQPIIEPRAAQKPPAPPAPKPLQPSVIKPSVPAKQTDKKSEDAKPAPKQSAIQGPKTMPALPTEAVQVQETFSPEPEGKIVEPTILERSQKEVVPDQKRVAPEPAPSTQKVAPASFDKGAQGVLKRTIPFEQGQIGLSSADIDPIVVAVSSELAAQGKEDWRVQIKAYASAYGTGASSDKRISLSRALSLRTALVAKGIPAARIDVLAEGAQDAAGGAPDRIDLYLYGPAPE